MLEDKEVTRIEVHTFSDASNIGHGSCAYICCVYNGANALLFRYGEVVPLKRMTIPRLELLAAVLAAKLSVMICREMDFVFN